MAIRHLISGPVEILTPSRDGKVVIRYQSDGRRAVVDVGELYGDRGISEVNQAIGAHNLTWDFSTWLDPARWHNGELS